MVRCGRTEAGGRTRTAGGRDRPTDPSGATSARIALCRIRRYHRAYIRIPVCIISWSCLLTTNTHNSYRWQLSDARDVVYAFEILKVRCINFKYALRNCVYIWLILDTAMPLSGEYDKFVSVYLYKLLICTYSIALAMTNNCTGEVLT